MDNKTSKAPVPNRKKKKRRINNAELTQREQRNMICDRLGFAAAESYKLLRTNLMFTLPADKKCRIIGVTSSIRGEGKSTTAINLSYSLAETGKKVLLIDADMRLPSVAKKIGMSSKPGLSNVLAGLSRASDTTQLPMELENWFVMPAGDIPPNPSELLGSERMHLMLEGLSRIFDFIVIDLPPVNIVTDALAVSPWIDGLVVAVRQSFSDRQSLSICMDHLSMLESSKVLGFVMTDVADKGKEYGRYKRYGYYYKKHGYYSYGYSGSYASAREK